MRYVLGIDPGLSGAYALVTIEGGLFHADDLPLAGVKPNIEINSGQLSDQLRDLQIVLCVIEKVHSMPKQGVSSTFKFGYAAGQARGVVDALKIPVMWVRPQQWKKSLGLPSDKEASRAMAIQAWPEMRHVFARKKDDGRAEAALIARYGIPYACAGLIERAA